MNEDNARLIALRCLETLNKPLLFDAAAITAFSKDFASIRAGRQPRILTPHAGEMAKLMGTRRDVVDKSPREMATKAARALNCVMVLKGAETYIALPDGETFKHAGGVAGLGTAGSGDALAGLLAALLARGAVPLHACLWGVFIHAKSGAILSKTVDRWDFSLAKSRNNFRDCCNRCTQEKKGGLRDQYEGRASLENDAKIAAAPLCCTGPRS